MATATIEPSLQILAGNNQSVPLSPDANLVWNPHGPQGSAYFAPLTVVVSDASNNPIQGAIVNFAPGPEAYPQYMAVQIDPADDSPVSVATDQNGHATLQQMMQYMPDGSTQCFGAYCYYATGPFQIVATVSGGPAVTFNLTVAS